MILNIGGRTDIVQYYTPWFLKRLAEGYVYSRNPVFPNKVTRYELTPDKIDGIVFGSKNYKPILPYIADIAAKYHTYFHYTITAYGAETEPGVPSIEESMDTLAALEELVGAKRIAWRYDPVLLTQHYTISRHLETFAYMAERLSGHVDRCILGFVEMHKQIQKNMPELILLTEEDKEKLARGLGEIAAAVKLPIQTCGFHGAYDQYGISASGCITLDMIGQANDVTFRERKHKGTREGCQRIENRDIGAYNTCLNGCRYCYANKNPRKALENHKLHDPDSPLLVGNLKPSDTVQPGNQRSFLKK